MSSMIPFEFPYDMPDADIKISDFDKTLRELTLDLKSENGIHLFIGIERRWNGCLEILCPIKHTKLAEHMISNLGFYLKKQHGPNVLKFFDASI